MPESESGRSPVPAVHPEWTTHGVGPWPGGPDAWPDDPHSIRSCSERATPATSSTGSGTGRWRPSSPTSTPAAPLPRRDRELAARPQHRLDRPERQRLRRGGCPHHRSEAVEQARRDGHRPLPARHASSRRRVLPGVGPRARPASPGHRQRRGLRPDRALRAARPAASSSSARRAPGSPPKRSPRPMRPSRSRSSARRAASMPPQQPPSSCTPGSCATRGSRESTHRAGASRLLPATVTA